MSEVVLLDPTDDTPVGTMEKLQAHRLGRYHAAISVLLLTQDGRHVLQQRAAGKYHSAGLWANACCSHPLPGEAVADAAQRRLRQEMGIETKLAPLGTIRYRARVGGLTEYEHVSLFGGIFDGAMAPDREEVAEVRLLARSEMAALQLTPWFGLYLEVLGDDFGALIASALAGRAPSDHGRFLDID